MSEQKKTARSNDWVPGLDELALRLQVKPIDGEIYGIALMGKSGNAYSLVQIMAHVVDFSATALQYVATIAGQLSAEVNKSELNAESGQSEETDYSERNPKVD